MDDLTTKYVKIGKVRSALNELVERVSKIYSTEDVIAECVSLRGYTGSHAERMISKLKDEGLFLVDSLSDIQLFTSISDEDLKNFGLVSHGHFLLGGRYTLPIRDISGEVVALVGWYPNTPRKYVTTPTYGFSKSATFFGQHHWSEAVEEVFLVEGIFDTLSLQAEGFPALGNQGLELSGYKQEMLKRYKKVIACPDGDSAGKSVNHYYSDRSTRIWRPVDTWIDLSKSGVKDIDDFLKQESNVSLLREKMSSREKVIVF